MRFLVKVTIPTDTGNSLVRDPKFGQRLKEMLADIKPETVYFAADNGQRTMYLVVDLADASRIPAVAEPLWLSLEAKVEFIPVMNEKEFAKAGPAIERAAKKY